MTAVTATIVPGTAPTMPSDPRDAEAAPFDLLDEVDRAGLTVAVVRTALELDLFALVAAGAGEVPALAGAAGCDERATGVLVRALLSLGLLVRDGGRLACSPVSEAYLHRGAPGDFRPILLSWMRNRDLLVDVVRHGSATTHDHRDVAAADLWRSYAAPDLVRWRAKVPVMTELARERGVVPPPGGRVLDLACGSGLDAFVLLLLEPTATAVCVDRLEVLDLTRRLAREVGVADRVVTVAADVCSHRLAPASVDVAVLANVAQYLTDDELVNVLAGVRSALVPGGVLQVRGVVVDDGTPGYEPNWCSAVEMLLASPGVPHRGESDYRALLRRAGFTDIRTSGPSVFVCR